MSLSVKNSIKCIIFLLFLNSVSSKIVSSSYPNENFDTSISSETKPKWSISNLSSEQTQEIEQLVKQSLENMFKNDYFGPKTTEIQKSNDDKNQETEDLDLSSPHLLKVPVPQPYPVHIPVKQPFTVPIFKLVPEEVERRVPIPVEKLVPVYKDKPVKIIVEKHHPVTVYKPYAVPIPVNTHILLGKKKEGYSSLPVSAHTIIGNEREQFKWF